MSSQGTYRTEVHSSVYRVDGEIGRFTFPVHDVVEQLDEGKSKIHFSTLELFPARHAKELYRTRGFNELALAHGVVNESYRKILWRFNRTRHQDEKEGTRLRTLQDNLEREGNAVFDQLEQETTTILRNHGFSIEGVPSEKNRTVKAIGDKEAMNVKDETIAEALEEVVTNMKRREMSTRDIAAVEAIGNGTTFEAPAATVAIHLDSVLTKQQKENRPASEKTDSPTEGPEPELSPDSPTEPLSVPSPKEGNKRPTITTHIARIEHQNKGVTLCARNTVDLVRFVLAFLLSNKLGKFHWVFYTDGQRSLQDRVLNFFRWHPRVVLILDWFHLVKKFKEGLSLACKSRETRNEHLRILLRLLWYGLHEKAIRYLETIPAEDVKNEESRQRLIGYLHRNKETIPCYALRGKLNLGNSSSPGERSINIVTSHRQKKNGMSWCTAGSQALTALSVVVSNGMTTAWISRNLKSLTWGQAA